MNSKYCLTIFILCLLTSAAFAQQSSRDMVKEKAIWDSLQKVAPKSVDRFKQATVALDAGDYAEATRLYEEVFKTAPDFDPVMRRLGMSLIGVGRETEGLSLLEMAVEKNRSPENLISLAQFLITETPNRQPAKADLERAFSLAKIAYQRNTDSDDEDYLVIIAQLALMLDEERDFRDAARKLARSHPNSMTTHYYNAVVAAMDERWMAAEDEIRKAQALGLPAEVASAFLESGIRSRASVWRYAYYSVYLVLGWAVGLLALFLLGKGMSKKTLNWVESSDPNSTTSDDQKSLRRIYRHLINAAGLYYYVSLPVVLFLVVVVAGSLLYGMFMLERIYPQLLLIVGGSALVTVFTMIRSFFIRVQSEDPGRALTRDEAPDLWRVAEEVAAAVGTRTVDEIRITPGTDMAVYERGSFKERMQDRARRILILGIGNLNDFRQNAFRAVLAHEYGHLSHRDTAGGDVALRVNQDMMKFAIEMARRGQAKTWNIAFQFLRLYHFIFRRISHGATRLQEVLADRVAVKNYGAQAFEEGLTHVIRRSIELEEVAYWEITTAARQNRSLSNLYSLNVTDEHKEIVERKVNETINRENSEDDTHPPAAERFRLAKRVACDKVLPADGTVWDLFENRDALTAEMSKWVSQQTVEAAN